MKKLSLFIVMLWGCVGVELLGFTFMDPTSSSVVVKASGTLDNQGVLDVTGVLNVADPASITGNALSFTSGIYTNDIFRIILTGQYDPNLPYRIRLTGGSQFNAVVQGAIADNVDVSGVANVMQGSPSFINSNAIQLGSALTLALQGELNQTLLLNDGVIDLGADLSLGDSVLFKGPGRINFNGFNLNLGQKDLIWTDTLLLVGAKNLALNAKLRVTGQWFFDEEAYIVGNSSVLDLTTSGIIMIKRNTTVTMNDLTIKGLGSGSILFEDDTAKLVLQNVKVVLDQSVTMTNGTVSIAGPSTVVVGDKLFTFNDTSLLSVDGTTLEYDTLDFRDLNNVRFATVANESLINGGSIRKVRSLKLGDFIFNSDQTLDRQFSVSTLRKLVIEDNATIDGDGFGYQFARNPAVPIFIVAAGKRAKFINILMKDVPVRNNSFGAGSQVIFGDQTTVEIGGSGVLNDTWIFDGQTVLNGVGNILQLGTGQLVLRPGASVLIDNITIRGIAGDNIRCMDNNCTLSFGNVNWVQDDTFTLSNGHFEVIGAWSLVGTSTFAYTSGRASTITSFGSVYLDTGMTFSYAPPIANRDLIVMENADALWTLNSATLASTTTGMRLTKGTIAIEQKSSIINDGAIARSEAISLGDGDPAHDVFIKFGASATLNVQSGILMYDNQV